ncbi:cytokine receptor-like factor 2 [Hippopotamus amphibius kiboko]|uniref:cytokine receptor-like factor 2 n=1 Tax=Hippopotamus amphibius kiboko TaxID=575201 RepID=UPI002594E088|nr:cytokine receptor-like factor 2 [Hippopotamus amphibius kiboko]
MRRVLLPWAASAVLLLGHLTASEGTTELGEALQLQIINFNFETVKVTWNASAYSGTNWSFFYKLRRNEAYTPCSNYILQQGYTAGCLLEVEDDRVLHFSIRNGTQPLLTKSLWISSYLKPRSLRDLSFQSHPGAVTVTCSDLRYKDLLYEIQHKSTFDTEWQSKEAKTCNVTIDGLDAEKCYLFRARVKTLESSYGSDTYPSDWSEVTHQQRGKLTESCQENSLFPNFILIGGMVTFLIISLLLLSLWKLRRIKKVLMPSVPDPKFTFSGLFESHQGNFQEWITDTQNVAHLNKMEDGEQECILEEAVMVQPTKAETPKTAARSPVYPQTGEEEAAGDPGQVFCQPPQCGEVVSLGDFMFVMSDNSYMMF